MSKSDTQAVKAASGSTAATPMLRTAKVVCQSGEYVCLIRDLSLQGVSLSFLHATPHEPRILLALANGQTYPIQRVWEGKTRAGYRFASHVSLDEFRHEAQPFAVRPIRLSIEASARVIDGRKSYSAHLLDISIHGARIACEADMSAGRLVSLQVSGMAQQLCTIIWSDAGLEPAHFGLQFQHPLGLKELAHAALKLQPFHPSGADNNPFQSDKTRAA
ncbi:MAG: PilZ domain-containing protein [Pseudomonadota bacterium]